MREPVARLPWGLVLTLLLLALLVTAVFRAAPGAETPAPWGVVGAAVALASGAFLVLRRLQGYFWGLLAGLAVSLHPLNWDWAPPLERALGSQGATLLVVAGVIAAWDLAAAPAFAWRSWLLTSAVLCAAAGVAWAALPPAGLAVSVLLLIGLPLGGLFAVRRCEPRASGANGVCAVLLGVAAPAAGLLLASAGVRLLDWPVPPGVGGDRGVGDFLTAAVPSDAAGLGAWTSAADQLHHWAWPAAGAVLPLLALGLLTAVRRGLKEWRARYPPLPWALLLYALVQLVGVGLPPRGARGTVAVALACPALLLAAFGVAEVLRAVTRPLVLPPPEERMKEEN
jgi:hypothetical protein